MSKCLPVDHDLEEGQDEKDSQMMATLEHEAHILQDADGMLWEGDALNGEDLHHQPGKSPTFTGSGIEFERCA